MSVGYADETVSSLSQCIYHGGNFLSTVPGLVKIILGKNKDGEVLWKERYCSKVQGVVAFSSFTEFVSTSPPRGLGATVKLLRDICRDDTEALDLIDQAARNPNGRPQETLSIIQGSKAPTGTTRDRGLRMLRDHRPDLHEMVVKGVEVEGANGKKKKYTAHQAMVEAGFRKKTFTIPADVDGAAKALRRRFGKKELTSLAALLNA